MKKIVKAFVSISGAVLGPAGGLSIFYREFKGFGHSGKGYEKRKNTAKA